MPKLYDNICRQCGKSYKGRGQFFCGNHCRVTWTNLHHNVAKRPDVRAKISASAKRDNRQKQLMTPEARAKAVVGISKANKGRKLSQSTKNAISRGVKRTGCRPPKNEHLKGALHWNWKGGISPRRLKVWKSKKYKEWRYLVFERDNYTCQHCKINKCYIEAHHIKSFAEYPDLRYDVNNGITLCKQCHKKIHTGSPKPKYSDISLSSSEDKLLFNLI